MARIAGMDLTHRWAGWDVGAVHGQEFARMSRLAPSQRRLERTRTPSDGGLTMTMQERA